MVTFIFSFFLWTCPLKKILFLSSYLSSNLTPYLLLQLTTNDPKTKSNSFLSRISIIIALQSLLIFVCIKNYEIWWNKKKCKKNLMRLDKGQIDERVQSQSWFWSSHSWGHWGHQRRSIGQRLGIWVWLLSFKYIFSIQHLALFNHNGFHV